MAEQSNKSGTWSPITLEDQILANALMIMVMPTVRDMDWRDLAKAEIRDILSACSHDHPVMDGLIHAAELMLLNDPNADFWIRQALSQFVRVRLAKAMDTRKERKKEDVA